MPLWQLSPLVHALLSLQAVPSVFAGYEQAPLVALQLRLWHASAAAQLHAVQLDAPPVENVLAAHAVQSELPPAP